MLKITFCAYDKPDSIGGPVTWLMRLLPFLQQHNIEPTCLLLFHSGNEGPLLNSLSSNGIKCKTSPFLNYTEDNIHWILSCLQEDPPNIFVPNLVIPAYYAAAWARKAGIFTLGVSHSDDPFYHAIQKEFVDGSEFFRLDGMVCVSRELEQQILSSPFINNVMLQRIPYGVVVPEASCIREDTTLRVAYVGRLVDEQKRISELTRAFCRMCKSVSNVEAVIVGDGPDWNRVQDILDQEGRALPIRLLGALPPNEIQSFLLSSHVIVLLSDYEGLPIALLEAMACGVVPVCLSMRSGISELIQDGVTGLIVHNRNENFIRSIEILRNDTVLWQFFSENAKAFIKSNFSLERSHQNWLDFLKSVPLPSQMPLLLSNTYALPDVNPFLRRADVRRPLPVPFSKQILRRMRNWIGSIKQRIS